jgi:hypothetical protein
MVRKEIVQVSISINFDDVQVEISKITSIYLYKFIKLAEPIKKLAPLTVTELKLGGHLAVN